MIFKLIGAFLVVAGCGGFGFLIAAAHRSEVKALQNLLMALEYISCEIQYRLTPLPELCQKTAAANNGIVKKVLEDLAYELNQQISPNVSKCMDAVLSRNTNIPAITRDAMAMLGGSLGQFDVQGQLKGLEAVRSEVQCRLEACTANQDIRLRSYQTLGLCAGAAMAILFI